MNQCSHSSFLKNHAILKSMDHYQKDSILASVNRFSIENELILPGQIVILGLSGGPDSIFLLHFLATFHQTGLITVIAAHLDHEWRNNSAQDVQFCHDAAKAYGINLVSATLSTLTLNTKPNGSSEEIGRNARRAFLEQIKSDYCADVIALAHHFDDQQETFFIRMIRGTSLTGLTAMHPRRGFYIRPLLQTKKNDILTYLHDHSITYLQDPTNDSPVYLRNRIRHHVVPALRTTDNRFDITFKHTLSQLQDTERYLQNHTIAIFQTISCNNPTTINIKQLRTLDPFIQHRLIIHWLCINKVPFMPSTALFQEIMRFLKQPAGGSHALHPLWSLTKKQSHASICHITK